MPVAIKLPDMGTNVEECKILAWKVQEGDQVKRGDILADVETDKAVAELESTAEGIVLRFRVPAGATAHTGEILAYVGQAGESIDDESAGLQPSREVHLSSAGGSEATALAEAAAAPARVSPMVRNLAAKLDVDLGNLRGTGVGGVITREDVQRAHAAPSISEVNPAPERLARTQAAVARAVQTSWREIPHLSVAASIDMTRAIALREKSGQVGARVSYDAIFLKAMALVVTKHPAFLAALEGESIVRPQGVNIALAVSFGDELHLPVIRAIDRKNLAELHTEISGLAQAVKAHTLKADQMGGATMALSNLGMFAIDSFDAIIFPGHSSILTVGSIQNVPAVVGDKVEIRPRVAVKLAADHRLINGRAAAEFLTEVRSVIESGNFS